MNCLSVFSNVGVSAYKKGTSGVVLLAIVFSNLGFLFVPLHKALAAQVTIDNNTSTASTEHTILGAASVFISDQVGYKFFVDSTGTCVYSKTLNAGTTWGAAIVIDSQTDCFGVTVWYDRWTPNDSGTYIHILTADPGNDDVWYNRLDTTNDERLLAAAPVSGILTAPAQGGAIAAGTNNGSITKGTDGTLYMAMNATGDSYVVECSSNCGISTSWTETGVNPMDLQPDFSLLMPLSNGDILLINRDVSADDMRSKVWSNSGGSWSGAWTTFDPSAVENATYDPGFAAAVDTNTGTVHLAYIDNDAGGTLGGTNDDVKTARYISGAWVLRTDVVTNTTRGLTGVSIGIDTNTSAIYVGYAGQTTPAVTAASNMYWKRSVDGMATWGAETGPVNTIADSFYGTDINGSSYQRLTLSWYATTSDDMIIENAMVDLVPPTEISALGIQNTEVRASTTNFYVGGAFVIDENVANRNVTSISITESGTVNAATALDNIRLRYDLDTSAPYDCVSESYGGSESQFGSTDTDGFSSANGISTFTGTVGITTTQSMCVYVVTDVLKSAGQNETLEISIDSSEADVVLSGGVSAIPNYPVRINGDTIIKLDTDFRIQRGVSTMTGDSITITAGVDYDAPASASSAFIRITNTGSTGAGPNNAVATNNADDVTVRITNPGNITNSITFQRGVGAVNNTRIAWEIIEYKGVPGGENEMIVRQQQVLTYVSGNAAVTSGTVAGVVTDADVAVFITSQYNPGTGATTYHLGASTAAWNAGPDTVTLTRGATGALTETSYAVVEFTGSNWKVQRAEHAYTAVGVTETNVITAVNSLSKAFLHVQKRFPSSTHANFGHEVWLSGIGQVSFRLDAAATTPASNVSVAWVIENTQTGGSPLDVTRSNGSFNTTGTSPQANNVNIGKTLSDLSVASIFTNNRSDSALNTWPEPILGIRLISNTQYEVWRADIAANINYRTEVVEWPTAERKVRQNYYRLYVDNNALKPTDPWPVGATNLGENTEMTANDDALALGDQVRIRMSLAVSGAALPASLDSFKLQFAPRVSTCTAVVTWSDIGAPGSGTAWRGVNNTPADGAVLSTDPPVSGDLVLSVATVAGTYEEANNTPANPYTAFPGDNIEYDWLVEHNGADDKTSYCFRMIESDGTVFTGYDFYPVIRTVGYEPQVTKWRWYDDETNATPSTPRAAENVSPSNIEDQNALKLRLVLQENSGADGLNVKFALQYSEYADFSQGVRTLTSTSTCAGNSLWCYYNGAGVDNTVISSSVISNSDSCVAGVGTGCGTFNEGVSTSGVTFDQIALTNTEYEFTILHAGARVNRVYYFRLYNLTYDEVVSVAPTFSNPSLVTQGALMDFSITGLNSLTAVAGITTDATTTATAIGFGSLPIGSDIEAAQRISIDTNATQGYQVLSYAGQQMLNSFGDPIPGISSTNASPASWVSACSALASGCVGYHTTDATLAGGSSRFSPLDSYAALDTTPREIMYSSIPANDTHDVVYKVKVTPRQASGDYVTNITYIAIPVH